MADGTTPIAPDPEATMKIPEAAIHLDGRFYMRDGKENLVPLRLMRATDLLEDEAVREIMARAVEINAILAEFKAQTLAKIAALTGLFDQEYGVKRGGTKGNVSLTSFDTTLKVQLAVADLIEFGPQLMSAKRLVDECLIEWTGSEGTRPEVQAIVQRAFNTDKEGLVNRAELFSLLRLEIEDARWQRAMKAIRDSIRPIGSKEYIRFYERADARGKWTPVTIDLAVA